MRILDLINNVNMPPFRFGLKVGGSSWVVAFLTIYYFNLTIRQLQSTKPYNHHFSLEITSIQVIFYLSAFYLGCSYDHPLYPNISQICSQSPPSLNTSILVIFSKNRSLLCLIDVLLGSLLPSCQSTRVVTHLLLLYIIYYYIVLLVLY